MEAVGKWLTNDKTPGRKVKQIDNRGSNFYIALYWSEFLAQRDSAKWGDLYKALSENEDKIMKDLIDCQGAKVDCGGYYKLDPKKTEAAMRPSKIFNDLIDKY